MNLQEYYRSPAVRARLVEYLGNGSLSESTCVYVTSNSGRGCPSVTGQPLEELWLALERGEEVARSLWDRDSLLAHLDVEYVNFDHPLEAYESCDHAFRAQAPVVTAIEESLLEFGIAPLHLLSGRGHHFVWKISRDSEAFRKLRSLGRLSDSLSQSYRSPATPLGEIVGEELGAAYSGLGMVMEYVGHLALEQSALSCPLSVQLTAVEAGPPGQRGREVVSIDLSEYGDPLHSRTIRIPFGAYLKVREWQTPQPPRVMIPHYEMDEERALGVMRDLGKAADFARRASVQIPDQSRGTARLLEEYLDSRLAAFHEWYHSEDVEPPQSWSQTYDRVTTNHLPPCVARSLAQPNDRLLKPAAIQMLVRTMMALGWHPRHVAGLLRSKYERDHGWIHGVHFTDPGCRADFYTRIFAGLFTMGCDDLTDWNCLSTTEKGYCVAQCHQDRLAPWRCSALERRRLNRLASPPFNELMESAR